MAPSKRFKLAPEAFLTLVKPMGSCIISDRITVDGAPVGLMMRGPSTAKRSGWQFFAGDESPDYTSDPHNFGAYEVNVVANYDPVTIPFLYALPGQVFVRDAERNELVEADDSEPQHDAQMPDGISVVQGERDLDDNWGIELPTPFRARVEGDGDELVFWRPCLTFHVHVFTAEEPVEQRLPMLRAQLAELAPRALEVREDVHTIRRTRRTVLSWRLPIEESQGRVSSLGSFVIGDRGHVLVGVQADREVDIEAARDIVRSVLPR